jgi:hypothetical protein
VQMIFIPAGRLTPAASVDVAVKIFMMPFRNAFSTVPRSEDDNPYTYTYNKINIRRRKLSIHSMIVTIIPA